MLAKSVEVVWVNLLEEVRRENFFAKSPRTFYDKILLFVATHKFLAFLFHILFKAAIAIGVAT